MFYLANKYKDEIAEVAARREDELNRQFEAAKAAAEAAVKEIEGWEEHEKLM